MRTANFFPSRISCATLCVTFSANGAVMRSEVEIFLVIGPNVGDRILRNPPPLDYSSGEVGILFCRDSNVVRFSDRVRKALQQFGQEGWEF